METTDRQEARQRITQKLKWPFKLPAWILAVVAVAVILVGVVKAGSRRKSLRFPHYGRSSMSVNYLPTPQFTMALPR